MFRRHGDVHNQVRDAATAARREQRRPPEFKREVVKKPVEAQKPVVTREVKK